MTLLELIHSRGMTVSDLANVAGVNKRSIEQYSYGRYPLRNARAWMAVELADALGITVRELIELE